MVAYSFKKRFVTPILVGLEPGPWLPGMKRQTIRARRKRHARPGEAIQLYTAQRTIHCKFLGESVCESVVPIHLAVSLASVSITIDGHALEAEAEREGFARADGFRNLADFVAFWNEERPHEHDIEELVEPVLIKWVPKS